MDTLTYSFQLLMVDGARGIDLDNARAIRAYEKAGFRREREIDTPDGRALLMVCDA